MGAAVPSSLKARFSDNWSLDNLLFKRLGGEVSLEGTSEGYFWNANNLRLDRVEVAIPPGKSFKRVFGGLDGKGVIQLNPFSINGEISMRYPRLMGLRLAKAKLKGDFHNDKYSISGEVFPSNKGKVKINLDGIKGGRLSAVVDAKQVSARWLANTAMSIPKVQLKTSPSTGDPKDFGELVLESFGGSIDGQLKALDSSRASLRESFQLNRKGKLLDPDDLEGLVDAQIKLNGPNLENLNLDMKLTGNLWPAGKKEQVGIQREPLVATLKGPLKGGFGHFSIINVPFSLLSLVIPVPSSLSGMFGFTGKYRLGKNSPELTADLVLNNARLADEDIVLGRGNISLRESLIKTDISLKSSKSTDSIFMKGQVPISSELPLDLRVESHGSGIRFLQGLSNGNIFWKSGTADLRMLIRGTINKPVANGFLVIQEGSFDVVDKNVNHLNASMLFDFNRLEVLYMKAKVGEKGFINSNGSISLFRQSSDEKRPLKLNMSEVPIKLPNAAVKLDSKLILKGALLTPIISGQVTIKEGFVSPQRKSLVRKIGNTNKRNFGTEEQVQIAKFPEEKWDLKNPLVLFLQDSEAPASKMLSEAIPKRFSAISFDSLRLRLGPDLRISSQPLANFNTTGILRLNGSFDQNLTASGLVRLTNGRVNLFTTTFALDRREPNVAIFTPSMGLIPFVDVKMTSRVPDTVRDASMLSSSNDFATNGAGAFGIGGSRFVKVEVTAIGPADRLADNFQLQSTPPLPRSELLNLIGGNSLSRLLGGGEREVLANVLSKSFVSPVLGSITGAFSERIQLSIYRAQVTSPKATNKSSNTQSTNTEESSGEFLSQQAWITEMGVDLTDKLNFSLQATPNRQDIPPQGTLTYQFNPSIGVLGAVDNNGTWQSQIQMLLRF